VGFMREVGWECHVRHESIPFLFKNFFLIGQKNNVNRVWKGMWMTIVTKIWNHRNKIVFKEGVVDVVEVFSLAQLKVWSWVKHKMSRMRFSYSNWYFSPVKCLESTV